MRFLAVGFLLLQVLSAAPAPGQVSASPEAVPKGIPGEVLVRLRGDVPGCVGCSSADRSRLNALSGSTDLDAIAARHGITNIAPVFGGRLSLRSPNISPGSPRRPRSLKVGELPDLTDIYLIHGGPETDARTLAEELARDPAILWAEPNWIYSAAEMEPEARHPRPRRPLLRSSEDPSALPNDPYLASSGSWGQAFPDLWGLFAIAAPQAWQVTEGEGAVVAVVDTGVDLTHAEIRRNMWRNPGEVRGNGVDDDGNGFADDVRGWDFTRCVSLDWAGSCAVPKVPGPGVRDRYGHGTHVAGIIAAAGDNGIGIIGVAPRAQIMAVKALSDSGMGAVSDLAAGIVYAAANGATVINASWVGAASETLRMALEYASAMDVVVVAAAGNSAMPLQSGVAPGIFPTEALAVGAITEHDEPAPFSNFGGPLALVAPGGGGNEPGGDSDPQRSILSLLARRSEFGRTCRYTDDATVCTRSPFVVGARYVRAAGASMAAAFVSGVAALVRAHHPEFTRQQTRQVLFETADDLEPHGWDPKFGYGRVNARAAVGVETTPVAEITAPINGDKLQEWQLPFTVRGSVLGPQNSLCGWRLTLYDEASHSVVFSQQGHAAVEAGVLGTLGAERLERGKRYVLELEAFHTAGDRGRGPVRRPTAGLVPNGRHGRGHFRARANRCYRGAWDTKSFLVPDPQFAVVPLPAAVYGGAVVQLSADGTRMLLEHPYNGEYTAWFFDSVTNEAVPLGAWSTVVGWLTADGCLVSYTGALPDKTMCNGVSSPGQSSVVYDVETTNYRCLPRGVSVGPSTSAVDTTGQRMVFTSNEELDDQADNRDRVFQLFLYDERDGRIRQLTNAPPGRWYPAPGIHNPAMDEAGRLIAYDAEVPLDPEQPFFTSWIRHVFVYDDTDGSITQLTGTGSAAAGGLCVSLSGDGRKLAFLSDGLFVGNPRTGEFRRVVDASAGPSCPLLSRDGTKMAFGAAADLDPRVENEDLNSEVFLLDLESGVISQVTDTRRVPDCNSSVRSCGAVPDAVDGRADVLVADQAFNPAGLPLPMYIVSPRLVRLRRPNRPPVLSVPQRITVPIRKQTNIAISASDPDGDRITFAAKRVLWTQPAGFLLEDAGDGSAQLEFDPTASDVGQYTIRVAAFDDGGAVAISDVEVTVSAGQ